MEINKKIDLTKLKEIMIIIVRDIILNYKSSGNK